jgi:hypothetical protein
VGSKAKLSINRINKSQMNMCALSKTESVDNKKTGSAYIFFSVNHIQKRDMNSQLIGVASEQSSQSMGILLLEDRAKETIYIYEDVTEEFYGSRINPVTKDWYDPMIGAHAECVESCRDDYVISLTSTGYTDSRKPCQGVACIKKGQLIPKTLKRLCKFCNKPLY